MKNEKNEKNEEKKNNEKKKKKKEKQLSNDVSLWNQYEINDNFNRKIVIESCSCYLFQALQKLFTIRIWED